MPLDEEPCDGSTSHHRRQRGLMFLRWQLNVLAMGTTRRVHSVCERRLEGRVIVCTTLIRRLPFRFAASSAGGIGHSHILGRMLVGPDHRALLPMSFCIGATYLRSSTMWRGLPPSRNSLGILTALIGAHSLPICCARPAGHGSRRAVDRSSGPPSNTANGPVCIDDLDILPEKCHILGPNDAERAPCSACIGGALRLAEEPCAMGNDDHRL